MHLEMFIFLPKDVTILVYAITEDFLFNMSIKITTAETLQEKWTWHELNLFSAML